MRASISKSRSSGAPELVDSRGVTPAPWRLHGHGYTFFVKLPMPRGRAELFAPTELAEARFGQLGCVMYVEYTASPVGPYRELLFMPGTFRFGARRLPSITKIYVSSQASVVSGQQNWGIPKELADFDVQNGSDGIKRVSLRVGERTAVELWFRHGKLGVPVSTSLVPRRLRTIGQSFGGRTYTTSPSARGLMQRAKVVHAWSEPGMFAELAAERVVAAVKFSKVDLTFPNATVL